MGHIVDNIFNKSPGWFIYSESVMMNVSKCHQMLFSSRWLYNEVHQSLFSFAVRSKTAWMWTVISSVMARFLGTLNIGWRVPCNKLLASSVQKANLWPYLSNINNKINLKYCLKKWLTKKDDTYSVWVCRCIWAQADWGPTEPRGNF